MLEDDKEPGNISRRSLIAAAALVPVTALTSAAQPADSALPPGQMRTLEAIVDRLIPSDELGPGAAESGVAVYIGRALAGFLAGEKAAFIEGLAAVDAFAHRSHDAAFAGLAPEKKDQVLTALEDNTAAGFPNARTFFLRVRRLTLEGMFGDPFYGGNRNFAGWDLIRYPGPRVAASPEEQKMGAPIKPYRSSAYGGSHGH